MKIFNDYLITLVIIASLINITLAFFKQNNLVHYLLFNILAYFIITVLYANFKPRARTALTAVGAIMFASFVVTVILEIMRVISAR